MRIIVTGGAGFIGSHIVDDCIAKGHSVAVIDNLSTGSRRNLNRKARFHKADIRDRAAIDRVFAKERPEAVNHHAALIEVTKSMRDPHGTFEANVLGTANVLAAFAAHGRGARRRFVFASTGGAIYGEPKKLPANEATPIAPLSPYGLSKYLAEETIRFYARLHGFSHVILRYTNVYGPRQNPNGEAGVVAIFTRLMKAGLRPTIFGDGSKSRDYVHVSDVVRANAAALRAASDFTVNIGTGSGTTDRMIFDAIARATGFAKEPVFAPYRTGEVYRISLDARLARRRLGWKPTVALDRGIKTVVDSL
ncbi:MAG TPA: NAD-dependent epimerase/dehydratase family protein [Candidatus Paceibacterota bacterium]|nr:NAD-dependent epimerase/dehydratase family protein [Candidatus Paceibacterota bacterium]